MSNVKIVTNFKGLNELRNSEEIIQELESQADAVIARCSGNYSRSTHKGRSRANVSISTEDPETYHKNLKDNELLKALGVST